MECLFSKTGDVLLSQATFGTLSLSPTQEQKSQVYIFPFFRSLSYFTLQLKLRKIRTCLAIGGQL